MENTMDNPVAKRFQVEVRWASDDARWPPSSIFESFDMDGIDQAQPEYETLASPSSMFQSFDLYGPTQTQPEHWPSSMFASLDMDAVDQTEPEHWPPSMFEGFDMDGIYHTQPEHETLGETLGFPSFMVEGLAPDKAEEEEGEDGREVVNEEHRCKLCASGTTKLLTLRTNPGGGGRLAKRCCLDCADKTARAWLTRNGDQLVNLTPAQQRVSVITHLLDRMRITRAKPYGRNLRDVMLMADYYRFCRGCLDFNADVEMSGQACNDCQNLRRCCGCGRSNRLVELRAPCSSRPECMNHDHAGILCNHCYDLNPKPKIIVIQGPKEKITLGVCRECLVEPTGHRSWRYCAQCRAYLRSLPGPKCWKCKLQPEPEKYKWCTLCRDNSRLAQRARKAQRELAVFLKPK